MSENNEVALNSDKEESEQIGQPEQEETENEPADQNVRIRLTFDIHHFILDSNLLFILILLFFFFFLV